MTRKRYEAEIVSIRMEVSVTVKGLTRGESSRYFTVIGTNRSKVLDDLDLKLGKILFEKEGAERLSDVMAGKVFTPEELEPPPQRTKRKLPEKDEYLEMMLSRIRPVVEQAPARAPVLRGSLKDWIRRRR